MLLMVLLIQSSRNGSFRLQINIFGAEQIIEETNFHLIQSLCIFLPVYRPVPVILFGVKLVKLLLNNNLRNCTSCPLTNKIVDITKNTR